MGTSKRLGFDEYRYQILPVSQQLQLDLAGKLRSLDYLKKKKNALFEQAFTEIKSFSYSRGPIIFKRLTVKDNIFLLRIGVERDLKRRTREFEVENIENWETALVAFNNAPNVQKCLIQQYGGFQETKTVAKILSDNLNKLLALNNLSVIFEPIFEKKYFWDLIKRYQGKVTQIDFELISPNMSNISESLKLDLAELNRSTNTQRTHLELNSEESSYLTPSQNDETIINLVEYSSNGGGDITIRVRGVHKKMHTSQGINEINIDEAVIDNASVESLTQLFRGLLE